MGLEELPAWGFHVPRRDPGPESSGGVGPESSGGVWGLNSLSFEGPRAVWSVWVGNCSSRLAWVRSRCKRDVWDVSAWAYIGPGTGMEGIAWLVYRGDSCM